jgi:hypothetical protein
MQTKRVATIVTVAAALALLLTASSTIIRLSVEGGGLDVRTPVGTAFNCQGRLTADNPNPPTSPVKLVFIHHSCGDDWLSTGIGNLGNQLGGNNYYVSDTYYEWGPNEIGSYTDIGNWWDWFRGPNSATYTQALYNTTNRHADYTRPMTDPGGENQIIMFKSCYPNSHLEGNPDDPPPTGPNPLRGEDCSSEHHTVGNVTGIYNDILEYFTTRQDKLFVVITAPPLVENGTDSTCAANARAFNNWLVNDWLDGYPYSNVAVFDFYNVLTSNGGDRHTSDVGWETGNHHRWWEGAVQHIQTVSNNFAAYGSDPWDSHPTAAGVQKATGEFVQLLNVFYHRWMEGEGTPTPTATGTPSTPTPTATPTATPTGTVSPTPIAWVYLPLVLKGYAPSVTPTPSPSPTPTSGGCPAYPPGFTFVTHTEVYSVPTLAEPAPRQWFTDPTFGTCLVRVTDRANDLSPDDTSAGLVNEYARVQSFNADGTCVLVRGTEMTWYLYDAQTLGPPLAELPLVAEPRWASDDPSLIYYSDLDEKRLMSYNVQTAVQTVVHDFDDDFPGQNLAAVWTCHEGRPSRDRRYWGLMAEDEDWIPVAFLVYDRQTDQVTSRDIRGVPGVEEDVDHVTISPLGTYFLASFDHYCEPGQLGDDANPCGLMVYDRDLTNGRGLLRIIGHYDPALDAQGREVIVYQDIDTDHISMLDLATGAVTPLWEIDFSHTAIGLHFSGLAYDRPGWALVSTHDDDPTTYTWMDDQVFAVELKPSGRVVRLAHTHSLVSDVLELDYWAEPHASVNCDFTRVVFTTNWGRSGTGEVEVFMIAVPPDWPERLP